MPTVTFTIKNKPDIPALAAFLGDPLDKLLAEQTAMDLRKHFRGRPGNKKGWSRGGKGLWASVAEATSAVPANPGTVVIAGTPGRILAHKITGGVIRPGPGRKALAIPLTEQAYRAGRPGAGAIPGLVLVSRKGKTPLLVVQDGDGGMIPHYVLVPRVVQKADPDAMPDTELQERRLTERMDKAIARKARR